MAEPRRILVIRLGALGDVVQSFGPFAAIRAHHRAAHITLLTTAPFAPLLARSPWFDTVAIDAKPGWGNVAGLARLARQLQGFDRIYDLQTSRRSGRYFWLALCPPCSGIGPLRRFPHRDPDRDRLHTLERQRGQLRDAGIGDFPRPELGWLSSAAPPLRHPYALLVPGAARAEKRWPADRFAALACRIASRGLEPVVVGAAAEQPLAERIEDVCPQAISLVGRTDLVALAALAAHARFAVGNDTGPMHLAAALGRPCIVLFGSASDPALTAPRTLDGAWSTVIRAPDLADLPLDRVAEALP